MRGERTQILLILSGVVTTALFGWFFYRELFPEYKIYQNAYEKLEDFRSTYTGRPAPDFKSGIKQIVIEDKNLGPAFIDRCTSCHVALQFQHFSPTQIATDVNGSVILDEQGFPKKEPNPSYVWAKLDEKIKDLKDPVANEKLISEGKQSVVSQRLNEAAELESLKTAKVDEHVWNMAKVLQMHPLIGNETRPFEFHPIDEYGCTTCHGGNGRGLTTLKAHGPVFDGQYEEEDMGPVPKFLEADEENDPRFSKVFNGKPGHELLFQTTPILVGSLIESKCIQCHQSTTSSQQTSIKGKLDYQKEQASRLDKLSQSYSQDLEALSSLIQLKLQVENIGAAETVKQLQLDAEDYTKDSTLRARYASRAELINLMVGGADGLRPQNAQPAKDVVVQKINERVAKALGSDSISNELAKQIDQEGVDVVPIVNQFVQDHLQASDATGDIFLKARALKKMRESEKDGQLNHPITQIDFLTGNFHQGEQLYINQACYACHRITGFARGGVGPELTEIGKYYPWYIKESIVWPQADLKTSTMPNYKLDHDELEDLVTFLLAQRGKSKIISDSDYKTAVVQWDAGKKLPWEEPVSPAKMHDVNYGLTVFATEGCAACHRLRGFTSNVGFAVENEDPSYEQFFQIRQWFNNTIPEMITGSDLVKVIEAKADEIDKNIVDHVRENGIIEQIEAQHPGNLESFYSNFKYAARARDNQLKGEPEKLRKWKDRVRRVLMVYAQEYGYGRVVGPRPNWSGVYRSDEWLMQHFFKPSSTVARSIMPVFPFNDTKFYALTHMLDVIGKQNRDRDRKMWEVRGFNPETAYNLYCSQCHGDHRIGNGPVAEWIYPVPKNLRNGDFMRNLTPERARYSIIHGVLGGPMPPWGEAPMKATTDGIPILNEAEVDLLVDWLYSILPGGTVIHDIEDTPKWKYEPEDVIEELKREGSTLKQTQPLTFLRTGNEFLAALDPSPTTSNVEEIFDVVESPPGFYEKHQYYIKKSLYTPENLEAGQAYFELNCAPCHGREGDGAGARAGVMQDAKPRMLINFPWLETRDDLRLIRSIKFGVSGTSMQPWGDQTTSLQRLQLVMFIRSLSDEQAYRDKLYDALYETLEESRIAIEEARIQASPGMVAAQNELEAITRQQQQLSQQAKNDSNKVKDAAALYQKQLELANRLKEKEENDDQFKQLRDMTLKIKKIYEEIGLGIISLPNRSDIFDAYLKYLQNQGQTIDFIDGKLDFVGKKGDEQKLLIQSVEKDLQDLIESKQNSLKQLQGKIATPEIREQRVELEGNLQSLITLRNNIISGIQEVMRIQSKQQAILKELNGNKNDNDIDTSTTDSNGSNRSL